MLSPDHSPPWDKARLGRARVGRVRLEDSPMELTSFLFGVYKLVKYALYPLSWVLLLMSSLTPWLEVHPELHVGPLLVDARS